MAYFDTDELLAAALAQLGREQGGIASGPYKGGASMEEIGTYKGGAEVVPMELADAFNSPVMWEPEVFDDTYVNPNGIRNDGTYGSTIEQHTDESRNNALFKSLPKDPASRVIWDMVPTEYHYLKQFEKEPRKIRLPEDARQDEVSNVLYDELFKMARANSANPESKFIRDPGGSGKLIKFHTPIDLRSLEQKMGGHPFNQI